MGACLLLLVMVPVGVAEQAELPTWSVGDSWALGTDDINLSYTVTNSGLTYDVTGSGSYYITYEIVGAEGDEYTVNMSSGFEFNMNADTSGTIQGMQASGSMNITMVGEIDRTIYYTKDELAVSRASGTTDLEIDAPGSFTVGGQSEDISMTIDLKGNTNTNYSPSLDLFDFPINVDENWSAESTATITGSMSGNMDMDFMGESYSQPISENLDRSVDMSVSVECPGTEDVSSASTAYKLVMTGTEMSQTSPFMSGGTLYYSPDAGFIVASEVNLSKAMSSTTLGTEEDISFAQGFTGADQTISLNSVSVQEAKDAIAEMGEEGKGINMMLVGALIGVVAAILVILVVLSRRGSGEPPESYKW